MIERSQDKHYCKYRLANKRLRDAAWTRCRQAFATAIPAASFLPQLAAANAAHAWLRILQPKTFREAERGSP